MRRPSINFSILQMLDGRHGDMHSHIGRSAGCAQGELQVLWESAARDPALATGRNGVLRSHTHIASLGRMSPESAW